MDKAKVTVVGRRRYSAEERQLILKEALAPGSSISETARRHGMSRSLIQLWKHRSQGAGQRSNADERGGQKAKRRAAGATSQAESNFVQMVSSPSVPFGMPTIRVVSPCGVEIEFPASISPTELAAFVNALRG